MLGVGLGIMLYFNFLSWLAGKINGVAWVIGIAGPAAFVVAYRAIDKSRHKAEEKRRIEAPCHHGVAGAQADSAKCSLCQAEQAARVQEEERLEEAARAERESRRRAAWAELIAKARTPQYLQSMDPREFEKLVCALFERQGYTVEPTPYSGDGGVDGFLRLNGKVHLLQCKRVKGSVGEPVLRDLFGTMTAWGADSGIVVTTGTVSRKAQAWAAVPDRRLRIIQLPELTDLVRTHFQEDSVVPASFEVRESDAAKDLRVCPKCSRPLREIKGRRGAFLGCTGYPGCRFTCDVPRSRRRKKRWR